MSGRIKINNAQCIMVSATGFLTAYMLLLCFCFCHRDVVEFFRSGRRVRRLRGGRSGDDEPEPSYDDAFGDEDDADYYDDGGYSDYYYYDGRRKEDEPYFYDGRSRRRTVSVSGSWRRPTPMSVVFRSDASGTASGFRAQFNVLRE